jgi:hypothetical protein
MSIDPHAGTAVNAGLCHRTRREIRRTIRRTARTLRREAGARQVSHITCRLYEQPDEIRHALAVCYADPTPGELAELDQLHAFLARHEHACVLVLATCEVTADAGKGAAGRE